MAKKHWTCGNGHRVEEERTVCTRCSLRRDEAPIEPIAEPGHCVNGHKSGQGRTICVRCGEPVQPAGDELTRTDSLLSSLVVTGTEHVAGRKIQRYFGMVFGEAVMGSNVFSDMAAGVRDVVGGRSAAYEAQLERGRRTALTEMASRALELNADGVIAVRLDYETLKGSMLMVTSQGTAVQLDGQSEADPA